MRTLLAVLLGGCTVNAPPAEEAPSPRTVGKPKVYRARVIAAEGDAPARTGDRCAVEVRIVKHAEFDCRVRVTCAGDLVYGLSDAGYNRCSIDDHRVRLAHDSHGTREDGDPRLMFDLETRRVRISDHDPDMSLELSLDPPRPAVPVPPPPPDYESSARRPRGTSR